MIVEIPAFPAASWNPWSYINVPVPDGATFVLTPDVIAQATEPGTRVEYDDHIFCLPANHVTIWLSRVDTPALFEQLRGPHDFSFALWDRRWVHIYRHMGWFLGNPYLTLEFASKEQATRYGSILCYTFAMAARRRA